MHFFGDLLACFGIRTGRRPTLPIEADMERRGREIAEEMKTTRLCHGGMKYRCEKCGRTGWMLLEVGLEQPGLGHKPVPFTIQCPHCRGWARDVSGLVRNPFGEIRPIPEDACYFENRAGIEHGVPVFGA